MPARGERCGVLGAHQPPSVLVRGHRGKGFVGLMRFPECEQKHGELSGYSDHGSLLSSGGAILGKPLAIVAQAYSCF